MLNLFGAILYMHIAGAGIIGLLLMYTIALVLNSNYNHGKTTALMLAAMTAFQLITGSAMSLIHRIPAQRFCLNMGLYIGLIVVAEYFLLMQSKKSDYSFPWVKVVSLFLFGITGVLFSFFHLYI